MNLIIPLDKFKKEHIIYSENMENKFLKNSKFVKISYSNNIFTLQSVFFSFTLNNYYFEDFFDKKKCFFNKIKNFETLKKLSEIEYKILENFNEFHNLNLNLRKLLDNCYFKLSNNKTTISSSSLSTQTTFLLRISGIWFQKNDCGLIFKFFIV